jgi:tryptophanyl-tRNA synthetase
MSVILTGIKPTGTIHLGNYFGAIQPALASATHPEHECRYFIADVHALNLGLHGPALRASTLDIAAAWMACGLDPAVTLFYRQSDVPEILQLATLLMPLTAKGLMNRAHAYKAKAAANRDADKDADDGVNMGLYTYPILMAADILAFDTDLVPVGADQVQHVEMAVDIAQAVNRRWGAGLLKAPRAVVGANAAVVPGADGRKMSKSYGNVLPLFAEAAALRKLVRKVTTDSAAPDAPKNPSSNVLAAWMRCVADPDEATAFETALREGTMGWGEAKDRVADALERTVGPLRQKYQGIRADEGALEGQLANGAGRARTLAARTLDRVQAAAFGR